MPRAHWTHDRDDLLRTLVAERLPVAVIAERLNLEYCQVQSRMRRLNLRLYRVRSDCELEPAPILPRQLYAPFTTGHCPWYDHASLAYRKYLWAYPPVGAGFKLAPTDRQAEG